MGDPWVFRCPNGHTSVIHRKTRDETQCRMCGLRWRGPPLDAREVAAFPVDPSEYEVIDR